MSILLPMELYELENEYGQFSLEKLQKLNMPQEDFDRVIKNFVQNCKLFPLFSHH